MESVTYRHLVDESMREGLLRGQQERHLERRFPSEVDHLRPLLDSASLEELEALGDDVLSATTAADLHRRVSSRLSGD